MTNNERISIRLSEKYSDQFMIVDSIVAFREALDEAEKRGVASLCRSCKHNVWACTNGCPEEFLMGDDDLT